MRLAKILICVIFISSVGQTAQAAISNVILNEDINNLYGWNNPELFSNDCRNTPQAGIESQFVTVIGFLLDDCLFYARSETAWSTDDHGGKKRLDYLDDKWAKFASTGNHANYVKAEISAIDRGRDGELANNPMPHHRYYNEVVSWIENAYHAWVAKDPYGSTRLLLLSFGLVGLIGIRRKFKKD